jgi:hypothetical protein
MTTLTNAQILVALKNRALVEDIEVLDTHNPATDDARHLAATISRRLAALAPVPPAIEEALGRIRPDCRALVMDRNSIVVDRNSGHVWGSGASAREAIADAIGGCPGLLVEDCRVVDLRDLTEDEREALRRVPGGHIIPDGSDNLDLDGAEMVLTAAGVDFLKTDCGAGLRAGEILIYEDTMNGGLAWRRSDESGPLDTSTELVALLVGLGLGRTR